MRKSIIIAFAAAAVLGGILYFAYQWLPNPALAVFAPINKSVWEHLKLLYWPVLLAGCPLAKRSRDAHKLWSALLWSILAMPPLLLGAYYTFYAGFGVDSAVVNVILYLITMAAGCALTINLFYHHNTAPQLGWLILAAGIYGAALAVFTISAPKLPVFLPRS